MKTRFFKVAFVAILIVLAVWFFSDESDLPIDAGLQPDDETPAAESAAAETLRNRSTEKKFNAMAGATNWPSTNSSGLGSVGDIANEPDATNSVDSSFDRGAIVEPPVIPIIPPPTELERGTTPEKPPALDRPYSGG